MAADETIIRAALAAAERTGVAAAVLLAIAEVESASRAFAAVEGRQEPLIRFEGHWFDRRLAGTKREAARRAGLAAPQAGAVRNPATQAARWALLKKAAAIDAEAAYAATSWGLGQVMGGHWKALGYASAAALAEEARRSAEGQFLLVAKFLKVGALDRLLEARRFEDFAKAYNGPGFRANRYDAKIARAFEAAIRVLADHPHAPPPAPVAAPRPGKPPASGWAAGLSRLFAALRWISHLHSMPADTRSFSTSTERSSASPTIPPASN